MPLIKKSIDAIGAPIYEIKPAMHYTRADLDWTSKKSCSAVEMQDKNCRSALAYTDVPLTDLDRTGIREAQHNYN